MKPTRGETLKKCYSVIREIQLMNRWASTVELSGRLRMGYKSTYRYLLAAESAGLIRCEKDEHVRYWKRNAVL